VLRGKHRGVGGQLGPAIGAVLRLRGIVYDHLGAG
jgi:hypothetical protein